jgi:hypothetical protein
VRTITTLRQRARAAFVALALSVGLAAVAAPTASAGFVHYYHGTFQIAPGQAWLVGPAHTITNHTAVVAYDACVGAINVYGGGLAGAGMCSAGWPFPTTVSHPYCGCVLRDGADYPYVGPWGYVFDASVSY